MHVRSVARCFQNLVDAFLLDAVAQIEAITAQQFTHQALIAKVNTTLQANFAVVTVMIDEAGGKAIEQVRGALQFFYREAIKDLSEFAAFLLVVGSQQALAGLGEGKANLAAIGLSFFAAKKLAADEFVDGFAGGSIADAEEQADVADGMCIGDGDQFEESKLREGQAFAGDLIEEATFNDILDGRGKDMRAAQEIVCDLAELFGCHPFPFSPRE